MKQDFGTELIRFTRITYYFKMIYIFFTFIDSVKDDATYSREESVRLAEHTEKPVSGVSCS